MKYCLHCDRKVRYKNSLWCKNCIEVGHTKMRRVSRTPWWTWEPYQGMDVEKYKADVIRALAKGIRESDESLQLKVVGPVRTHLPP